jgi:hypothetical protein
MISFEYKHLLRHNWKDALYNFYLCLRSDLNSKKRWKGKANPPKGYELVFQDDFKDGIDFSKWGEAQPWGEFHPDYPHQWYGKGEKYNRVENGILNLEIKHDPRTFVKNDLPQWQHSDFPGEELTIPTGIGMIHSKESWLR